MRLKNLKLGFIFLFMFVLSLAIPKVASAEEYKPENMNEAKSQIENAVDGDVIDFVKLYNRKEFKQGGNDFSDLGTIKVNNNITIMSSDPKQAAYGWSYPEGARAVYISNVSFDVADGKTLTMKGHLYLKGPEDKALISGDGNLYLTERMNLSGQNGNPAIYLPKGSVRIENLMSYAGEEETGENNEYGYPIKISLKYYSRIIGGDSTTHGADAIFAKTVEVNQTNLEFIDKPYRKVDRGLFIRGGHGLSDDAQGGHGINAENITIDLSGEKNGIHDRSNVISGGAGGYGQGALLGKNIEIICAGKEKILSGPGVDLTIDDVKRKRSYYGTIEVEYGGHLNFATKEFPNLDDKQKLRMNTIFGGDAGNVDYNGNKAAETFFEGKRWTNFYGPVILAKENASVNIYRGKFTDSASNHMMPGGSQDPNFMDKLPHSSVIEMGSGLLNIGVPNQEDAINLGAGFHFFNTSKAVISSNADINVYGAKTFVEGSVFGSTSPNTGYSDNPKAPKVGAAGIKTTGKVLIDGANICGGGIHNILSDEGSKKDDYRFGSGIVDAEEVRLVNGAVVQGYGSVKYLRDEKIDSFQRGVESNVSAGYGLENVSKVYIENSEVHGGDISTTRAFCPGSEPKYCKGNGIAGPGIKGAETIEIIGDSLITGGSSTNIKGNLFADRLTAGSAIDGSESVVVKGGAQIYGGGSSTKSGHGIANVDNVVVESEDGKEPVIIGGGCRPTQSGNDKQAGSGFYMVGDATIRAGKIEAGNKLYQTYIEGYSGRMHHSTKGGGFSGLSPEAYAISAKGKVIIDGEGQFTPKIMSYTPFDGLVKGDPISTIFLENDGALYVGKAKVFSGGNENYREKNILVKGGKYHVDIFKENTINSYEKAGDDQGIKYKADGSVALYRILNKNNDGTYSDFAKDELKASAAYDGVFEKELGLLLYKENLALGETLKEKSFLRKSIGQGLETLEVEDIKDITNMARDNIVLEKKKVENYYIKYDLNNDFYPQILIKGNAPLDTNSYKLGDIAIVLAPDEVTAEGYRFLGWNTERDGSGKTYLPGDKIEVKSNLILYAQWEQIEEKTHEKHDYPKGNLLILKERGSHIKYIFGYPDGNLLPEGNITRAEAAAIAVRLKDIPTTDMTKANYVDLKEGAWYIPYINAAIKNNLLEAERDKIRPDDPITRAEMARLLSPIDKTNNLKSDFQDIIGHRYEKEINQAYGNKRIIGYPDGSFKPDNYITRAEAVIMFNSIFNRVPDKDFINKNEILLVKFKDLKKDHWAYYELEEAANSHEFDRENNNRDETWIQIF
ncbi:S-layer homology domain-containing protein [Peptoniphilus harei]|uniref:S-layer homology domain-containing protein n=1 Tax=Peptoniphilus harei TaxID=54005 RepID=UPI00258F0A84|nr:S-layer homology domain-containing protein [Peptoniphilus harei]MDU6743372.1 S-layer homology domain-containing protein [Peptoniphilus harei]